MTILRTGEEVPDGAVMPAVLTLELLAEKYPVALCELVELARDPSRKLFGNTGGVLRGFELTDESGRIFSATRAVVLAAAVVEDGNVFLRSPYAESAS